MMPDLVIPSPTWHDTVGYILQIADFVAVGVAAWFVYLLRGLSKDIKELRDMDVTLQASIKDAIAERNKKIENLASELKMHEDATLSLNDKIHACQLEHLQKMQRSELRNSDLKEIKDSLIKLFDLARESAGHMSEATERLARVEATVDIIKKNGHGDMS